MYRTHASKKINSNTITSRSGNVSTPEWRSDKRAHANRAKLSSNRTCLKKTPRSLFEVDCEEKCTHQYITRNKLENCCKKVKEFSDQIQVRKKNRVNQELSREKHLGRQNDQSNKFSWTHSSTRYDPNQREQQTQRQEWCYNFWRGKGMIVTIIRADNDRLLSSTSQSRASWTLRAQWRCTSQWCRRPWTFPRR
jgi:hypothetical protein